MKEAAMTLEYTTAKRRKDPIPFSVDGRSFQFTPSKLASTVLETLTSEDQGALLDWFATGLSPDDEKYFIDRLGDSTDDFDIDDLGNIITSLLERVVGRPTKSRSGLRRSR